MSAPVTKGKPLIPARWAGIAGTALGFVVGGLEAWGHLPPAARYGVAGAVILAAALGIESPSQASAQAAELAPGAEPQKPRWP